MPAATLLAAAAMAMPGTGAAGAAVDIPGRYFTPADLQVLVGETVTWTNDDHAVHTVMAEDHSFGSSRLTGGGAFEVTFDDPGSYRYYCTVHREMRGTVTVSALGLTGPAGVLHPGDEASFSVLAPAGTDRVTLERVPATGASTAAAEAVDEAEVGADGRASLRAAVSGPGRFRARAGGLTSAPLDVRVAPVVTAAATRRGRLVTVKASITPARPGATVQLKRYVRERFDYLPIRTARTAGGSTVTFKLSTARRLPLRVGVKGGQGGWAEAESRLVVAPRLR